MKKSFKKAITAGLISLASILPAKASAESLLDRLSISAGYSMSNADCMKDFYQQQTDYWKAYFPEITNFKDIESPKGLNMLEGKLDYRFYKGISASVGGGIGSISKGYNQSYIVNDPLVDPITLNKTDKADITKMSVGLETEKNLGKGITVFIQVNYDIYIVSGNSDMTFLVRGPPITDETYRQWRKANFSGSGSGFSVKAGGQWFVLPNVAIGVSGGYQTGNVQTKGNQTAEASTTPGFVRTYDYSPNFNIDSFTGNIEATFKF